MRRGMLRMCLDVIRQLDACENMAQVKFTLDTLPEEVRQALDATPRPTGIIHILEH